MNPELSRRVAKVIDIMVMLGLSMDDRMALAQRVDSTDSFEDLPLNDQKSILAAEKLVASGKTLQQIMEIAIVTNPDYDILQK